MFGLCKDCSYGVYGVENYENGYYCASTRFWKSNEHFFPLDFGCTYFIGKNPPNTDFLVDISNRLNKLECAYNRHTHAHEIGNILNSDKV